MKDATKLTKLILIALAVWSLPAIALAAPVSLASNTCPASLGGAFDRQYQVDDATRCVYDPDVSNIQGTTAEANTYLNVGGDTGWVGAGQTGSFTAGHTLTLTSTCAPGETAAACGTFTYAGTFTQIAVGIKDGGNPQWGIFVLPAGDFSSFWSILGGGSDALSHFTLYGRTVPTTNVIPGETAVIPEPASLLLLGTGLGIVAAKVRNRNKKRA